MKQTDYRYLLYCADHGHAGDPDGMLAEDRERFPDGHGDGYFYWIRQKWIEFMKTCPDELVMASTHDARFDHWLGIREETDAKNEKKIDFDQYKKHCEFYVEEDDCKYRYRGKPLCTPGNCSDWENLPDCHCEETDETD